MAYEFKFKPKQLVNVEGSQNLGEVRMVKVEHFLGKNDVDVIENEKYYVKVGMVFDWYPVGKLKLAIDNMDYIDPAAMKTIDYLCTDAHLDNKNFDAIIESAANEDVN